MSAITSLNCSNRFRSQARMLVTLAIGAGHIEREKCACGRDSRAWAHHDDYDRPFDVRWLCGVCHANRHRELGWGFKGSGGLYHGGKYSHIETRLFASLTGIAASATGEFNRSLSITWHKAALAVFETQEAK